METQAKNLFKLIFSLFYRLMKKKRCRRQRILIISLLSCSLFSPMVLLSKKLKTLNSVGQDEYNEDMKYRTDDLRLNAVEQKASPDLKGRKIIVLNKKDLSSVVSHSFDEIRDSNFLGMLNMRPSCQKQMIPKLIIKAKIGFKCSKRKCQEGLGNSYMKGFGKTELVLKISAVYNPSIHSRDKSMEVWLAKMNHALADCFEMAKTLGAMANDTKEQVQAEKNQESYLIQVAGRTTPKGLHCLSMCLTAEYFLLQPEERQFPNQHKLHDLDLYHYAVFSDEILACAVVINSTTASAKEPRKIVFHVLTDSLNLPAISMWFLLNPPGGATIHVQSIENFDWLSTEYFSKLKENKSGDPRYTYALNHLRFYLADIFPSLDKIVLFDHDVAVQRDLTELWTVDMKRKVHAAVKTCQENEASFRSMRLLMNISDPFSAKRFNSRVCTWAFGMNLFDLKEWRRQNLTMLYHDYLQLGLNTPLSEAGRLPLGWITFNNQTVVLNKRWHALGLGHNPGLKRTDIENAAVIHYDGIRKPWLEIGIAEYKGYWSKHLQYDHPYLQQCNTHE